MFGTSILQLHSSLISWLKQMRYQNHKGVNSKLGEWAREQQMKFNVIKCKARHVGIALIMGKGKFHARHH